MRTFFRWLFARLHRHPQRTPELSEQEQEEKQAFTRWISGTYGPQVDFREVEPGPVMEPMREYEEGYP